MGQPDTPARRTSGGFRSAARRGFPAYGASAEGDGVVCTKHHKGKSRSRRYMKDRRGKWHKMPRPNPCLGSYGRVVAVARLDDKKKNEAALCKWRQIAAPYVSKTLQKDRHRHIVKEVALQLKIKTLQGAQEQIKELKNKL